MSFESSLNAHLRASATLVALVADRVHPLIRPEGSALPAVIYQVVGLDPINNLSGRDGSLRNVRVQVDVWASSFASMLLVYDAVVAQMDTAASSFRSALSNAADDYESDTKLYRRMLEFSCWFTDS